MNNYVEDKYKKAKIIRVSTISLSLDVLLRGQLHYLNRFYEVIAVSGYDKHLENVKDREGVKIVDVSFKRNISIFHDVVSLIRLYIFFLKERPVIVHSITPKAGLISMLAAKFAFVPIRLHTFTGLIFPSRAGILRQVLFFCDKIICWAATDVYPEGQGVKNDLIKNNVTSKPLKVISNGNVNGIDTSYFSQDLFVEKDRILMREKLSINAEDFVFLFVGRFVREKGINELIRAFNEIGVKYNNAKLLIVGSNEFSDDQLDKDVLTLIYSSCNVVKVDFQEDVRPYYLVSDCLVLPSYREGFPNVLLQAGAMGLPSIVTDVNGSNEIIQNGLNGIIVPCKDQSALKTAMIKLYLDKEFILKLSAESRRMITSRYEHSQVLHSLRQEYNCQLHSISYPLEVVRNVEDNL
jgi:glycosyltransferase involved in cell wall biosynthesis